jgi:hypothetical protein
MPYNQSGTLRKLVNPKITSAFPAVYPLQPRKEPGLFDQHTENISFALTLTKKVTRRNLKLTTLLFIIVLFPSFTL